MRPVPTQQGPKIRLPADTVGPQYLPPQGEGRPTQRPSVTAGRRPAPPAPTPDWSEPVTLLGRLEGLVAVDVAADWARSAAGQIRQLTTGPAVDARTARSIFASLRAAAAAAPELAESLPTAEARAELRQAVYGLTRRLDGWQRVLDVREQQAATEVPPETPDRRQLLYSLAEVVMLTDDGTQEGAAWRQYLMLDALAAMVDPAAAVPKPAQQATARLVLRRLAQTRLTPVQREFVRRDPLAALDRQLRDWAVAPVDCRALLAHLERFEATGAPSDARRVMADYESLICAPQAEIRELAHHIDRYYRNANLRVAIAGDLINRCVPPPAWQQQAVRDTVAGAEVTGRSRISTELSVRLIPDPSHIRLDLEAAGTVLSNTAAQSGPATILSNGRTDYRARKLFLIGPDSVWIKPAVAEADSQSQLRSLETRFDRLPLFGQLIRGIARSQHDSRLDQALREVETKVSNAARARLDVESSAQVAQLAQRLETRIGPTLGQLSVHAVPLDAQTTDARLVVRLRISNEDQLGGHTARPWAPSDSQLSLQVHESTLQNLLGEFHLDGQRFTLPELYRTVAAKLGRPDAPLPDDLPEGGSVEFAACDAVRIRCDDGQMRVTLAIAELATRRQRFRDFQVVVAYRPDPSGLRATLVRDGIIRLEGRQFRLRSQAVLRGVFAAIFPRREPVDLLHEGLTTDPRLVGLQINQFVADDGWIGLAVGPAPSPSSDAHGV